jgi:peptidoglycan hydrolase-like protein with peptidoglycan-binding domain
MVAFRSGIAAILAGTAPIPRLIPAIEPAAQPGASAAQPTLRRRLTDELVKQVQAKVGVVVDGNFGAKTEDAVRRFQLLMRLSPMALSAKNKGCARCCANLEHSE